MKAGKYIVVALIVLIIIFSTYILTRKNEKVEKDKSLFLTIPSFSLTDINGKFISESSLENNKSTLFLFFDPECENCREEFEQIKKYRDSSPDCNMFFVSILPEENIRKFLQEIDFQPTENMLFLTDAKAELLHKMDIKVIPSALIYNKERNLVKRYTGQVKVETLIKYFRIRRLGRC
jgi:peroxiredoxin